MPTDGGRPYRWAMARSPRTLRGIPLFDVALAAVLATAAVASTVTDPGVAHPFAELVGALVALAVGLRTVAPLAMAATAATGIVVLAFLPNPSTPLWAFATLLVIAFSITANLTGVRALVALAILLAAGYVIQVRTSSGAVEMLVTPLILVSAPALAGWLLARARAQAEQLRTVTRELEQSRERVAVLSAEAERTRLARELHDVLGHTLSSIAVQAGALGEILGDEAPGTQRQLADQIRRAARDGLDEVRALLDTQSRLDRAHGIEDVAALAEIDGAALVVVGRVRPLTPECSRAGYRIVQEALTNARRHAPGTPVRIALSYGSGELAIDVVNDGPVPPVRAGGRGLDGARERALAVGGSAEAGPDPRGWRVHALLPLRGAQEDVA